SCPRTKLAHDPLLSAILVMSQNPHFCDSVRGPEATPKPLQATPKPYHRHILGIDSRVQSHSKATPKPPQSQLIANRLRPQSHLKATPKPHQGYTKATPRLHQGYTKATPKPPQSHLKATPKLLLGNMVRAFQGLGGVKTVRFAGSLVFLRPGRNMTLSPRLALRTWPERGCTAVELRQ